MRIITKRTLLIILLLLTVGLSGYSQGAGKVTKSSTVALPSVANIKSIQAYTEMCWYGQKLTKIEITYQDKVNLAGVTADTYTLLDRGYANPDFAKAILKSVDVSGRVVILNITVDAEAMDANTMIYSGDNATGVRTKNPIGLYVTGLWYRAVDGVIYFGKEDSGKYKANTSGDGYQTRKCLELKLYHSGETEADAACLANEDGSYNAKGLWLPTIDANFGKGGFQSFEALGIEVPTTATDGDKFVKGWAYFPKGFDKKSATKYPLIITITGYGTSYWKHSDGTNNFGSGLYFDGSGFRWMDCGAIVLNIHDRSHTGGDSYKFYEDDYNVIQHFIQNYNADPKAITLTGNSRGTIACNTIASTYPGLIKTLVLNNGSVGTGIAGKTMFEGVWTDAEWQNAAKYGTSIWGFDGEQDTNNKDTYQKAINYYKAAGWSDDWIAKNIRLTGFPTNLYYYWGETDHSTVKMTYWYFFDQPFYGPDAKIVNGKLTYNSKLNKGDTFQLKGSLVKGKYNKEGFNYVIYGETLRDWVLSRDYETR
jgi:pimeloyl-ACP methyl ester carboxylesterase